MKNVSETGYICSCTGDSMEGSFFLFVWLFVLRLTCQSTTGRKAFVTVEIIDRLMVKRSICCP